MILLNGFKIRNFIIIELYYILLSIKAELSEKFIDIQKLSLDYNYFVILNTGLYLYDSTFNDCSLIHKFNNSEFNNEKTNMVNITELYNEQKAYIFCLVNEYLYIFNEYTYKISYYKINEISNYKHYYSIMPYKIKNNNISFIIAFNNDTNKLDFYIYNFNLNEGINKPKVQVFNNMNIEDKMIRCQINSNSTFIICFYYSKNNTEKYFVSTTFRIKNMNMFKEKTFTTIASTDINQIKIALSYNDNFFVCYSEISTPICLINDHLYNFEQINCNHSAGWTNTYKAFYFKEVDDFILVSRYVLTSTILNNYNNSVKVCGKNIFRSQTTDYSLIYIIK
jgi:hypothetical protein